MRAIIFDNNKRISTLILISGGYLNTRAMPNDDILFPFLFLSNFIKRSLHPNKFVEEHAMKSILNRIASIMGG